MTPPPANDIPPAVLLALAASLLLLVGGGAAVLLFLHDLPILIGSTLAIGLGAWLLWWGMVRLPGMRG